MIQTIPEFFENIEEQLKKHYWLKFFRRTFLFFIFLTTFGIGGSYLLTNGMGISNPSDNPHLLQKMLGLLIFMTAMFSLMFSYGTHRHAIIKNLKIDEKFKQINLYESYKYFVKQEYPKLSEKEVDIMVEQFYEESRLKELLRLTVITSDIKEKNTSDEKKEVVNQEYLLKERKANSKTLICQNY